MRSPRIRAWWVCAIVPGMIVGGCTVHPVGESEQRAAMMRAGKAYVHPIEARALPILRTNATGDELVTYALLSNGDVERKYWEWRAALEQVPQEGTQKTGLMISLSSMVTNGRTAWDTTTLMAGNDPMNNVVLPTKLRTAATVALQEAKAAGLRFDKARLELRAKVLTAYAEYALTAEEARLDEANVKLLEMIEKLSEIRLASGGAAQQDLLKAVNELEMAKNELATRRAEFPKLVAEVNGLLNRAPGTVLDPPAALPEARTLPANDDELLAIALRNNPELLAQARELAAKRMAIELAKQEYIPDFGVSVGTDLQGMAQSLAGSIVVPAVRYQAINGAIDQAKANLRAADAMRRQAGHDLAAQIVGDLATINDSRRQAEFFEKGVLPRLERIVTATRNSYATGRASMLETLDAERSLIAVRRIVAELRVKQEQRIVTLEAATGIYSPLAAAR